MAIERKFSLDFHNLIDPLDYFEDKRHSVGRAATEAVRDVTIRAKEKIRADIRRNFRHRMKGGSHFEKSFRIEAFPRHAVSDFSYRPAAQFTAEASWADVFEEGRTIRSSRYDYLAIPTEEAEKLGLDEVRLGGRVRRKSSTQRADEMFPDTFVMDTDQGKFIAGKDKAGNVILLFTLKRSVREKKLLSITERAEEAHRLLPLKFGQNMPDE